MGQGMSTVVGLMCLGWTARVLAESTALLPHHGPSLHPPLWLLAVGVTVGALPVMERGGRGRALLFPPPCSPRLVPPTLPWPATSFLTTPPCWRNSQRTQCLRTAVLDRWVAAAGLAAAVRRWVLQGKGRRWSPCKPRHGCLWARRPSGGGRASGGDSMQRTAWPPRLASPCPALPNTRAAPLEGRLPQRPVSAPRHP